VNGNCEEAITYYKKALALDSSHFNALSDLGYSYQKTARIKKAIKAFLRALMINPRDNKIKAALAATYAWAGNFEMSIAFYSDVLNARDRIDVRKEISEIYIRDRQYNKAKIILKGYLRNHPRDQDAQLLFAQVLQHLGEAKRAIGLYETMLAPKQGNKKSGWLRR